MCTQNILNWIDFKLDIIIFEAIQYFVELLCYLHLVLYLKRLTQEVMEEY